MNKINQLIAASLAAHTQTFSQLDRLFPAIEIAAARMVEALRQGGKIIWMGNGGSAADAQHLAAELVGRFMLERAAIPSLALTTDTSILTALSNDCDYNIVFSRQLEALCQAQDVVVGISTSGRSRNVLLGIETAKRKGAFTVAFSGNDGGELAKLADLSLIVPSNHTARIQEAHIFIGHILCEWLERAIHDQETCDAAFTATSTSTSTTDVIPECFSRGSADS